MIAGVELDAGQGRRDVSRHGAEIAVAHVAGDINAPRPAFPRDLIRCRRHPHVRDRCERRVTTSRQLDRHSAEGKDIASHIRGAPYDDVKNHLRVEDLTNLGTA